MLPWDEWWEFELNKDDSNPHIALLPLHPDMRAKFNETAAWEYAQSMNGKPYGYHNMLFSWIDTINANYPPPLDAHVVRRLYTCICVYKFFSGCIQFVLDNFSNTKTLCYFQGISEDALRFLDAGYDIASTSQPDC